MDKALIGGSMERLGGIVGSLNFDPIVIPVLPDKLPDLTVTLEQFEPMTEIVIDNVEGAYYNPDMITRFKPSDQEKLRSSGETMFGLDRKAGASLAKYPEWKQFWSIVDTDRAKNPGLWKYEYRGGALESQLKKLTAAIMYKWFQYLAGKYIMITSMDEIAADQRLVIHFSYACWNGEAWFRRYSKSLNKAIQKFPGDKNAIFTEAFNTRLKAVKYLANDVPTMIPNLVIRQQGENLMKLFKRKNLI